MSAAARPAGSASTRDPGDAVLDADVGIVGAGPGGMAAAIDLAAAGASVVVLDEGLRAGGQIFRQLPESFAATRHDAEPPSHRRGHQLLADLLANHVRVEPRATVWDAAPGRLWFEQDGRSRLLRCQYIVLAPGAYDRCIPFPGWTLPGVVTAGAAQVMVRGFGVKPGHRALVVGTGPLLLPTVTALLSAGVGIAAALEAAPRMAMLRAVPAVLRSGARLREAWFYLRALGRAGVKLRWGHTVFAVQGDGRVQRAIIGRVDRRGRPRLDTAEALDVDVVCAGFGLVPSIELGQRLGCATVHDAARGGHCVRVDADQRTSVPAVWAVGEIAGVGGSEVAEAEGRVAAAAILRVSGAAGDRPDLRASARRRRRAADAMLRAFVLRPGLFALADAETVVCRCEDVSVQQLRKAALHGDSARALKMGCRAGMGPCQARICGPNLQAMAFPSRVAPPDEPVVQVPLKPVRTATMIDAPRD